MTTLAPPKEIPHRNQSQVQILNKRLRILLTGCNSLVGQSIFQEMRNDDIMIKTGGKAHEFLGTLVKRDAEFVPSPSESIILLDNQKAPKTFAKGVLTSDIIIVDLLSGTDYSEAESVIKLLKQPLHEKGGKQQRLIVLSSVMAWCNTRKGASYTDSDYLKRVPTPKYQYLKDLENLALSAKRVNQNLRVNILCSGLPFGNGEANDIFYEFFRRSWLSSHPELAALPVVGDGQNSLPTIHVRDLTKCIRILVESKEPIAKPYLIAVDQCETKKQADIMQAISSTLGSGAIKKVRLNDVIHEEWVELLSLDLDIKTSPEFMVGSWHCAEGITQESMRMLNLEFNHFRGLFPLKVFIGGPPLAGKTHFASKLAQAYGIPHLKIADLLHEAQQPSHAMHQEICDKIEELKDAEVAAYEKTRKKKDPDLDRNSLKPRLPDDIMQRIVRSKINSPACMNKGFIMDGYPKNQDDAKAVFFNEIPKTEEGQKHQIEDYPGFEKDDKIIPQYVVFFEADDSYLKTRAKEIQAEPGRQENHTEAHTDRRLKIYRESNPPLNDPNFSKHLISLFKAAIGEEACLLKVLGPLEEGQTAVEAEAKTLTQIQCFVEQNGKPCCINLITEGDLKFLKSLEPVPEKPVAEAVEQLEGAQDEEAKSQLDVVAEEDLDEIDLLIRKEEQELLQAQQEKEANEAKEQKLAKERRVKEEAMAAKMEEIRRQERDLLDERSQPIRQYLMDNVVPHLTEGLIELCKSVPEDAIDHLANFLLDRADKIDDAYIKKREEEYRLKQEQKRMANQK